MNTCFPMASAMLLLVLAACAAPADDAEDDDGASAATGREDFPRIVTQAFVGRSLETTQAITLRRVGTRWFAEANAQLDRPVMLSTGAFAGVMCSIDGPAGASGAASRTLPKGSRYRVAAVNVIGEERTASFELSLVDAAGRPADFMPTCGLFKESTPDRAFLFR